MLADPEKCCRVVLFRHPELADADRGRAVGGGDATLSRRAATHAIEVLRALAPLSIDHVFSSPAAHCRRSAEAIAQDRGLVVTTDERLRDQNLGSWQGRPWTALHQDEPELMRDFFADYGLVAPPGGESLSDAVDRTLEWWSASVEAFEDQCIVVVSAAPLLSGFAARLLGVSIRRAPALSLPAAAFGILDVFRDGAFLRSWHPLSLSEELP